MDRKWFKHFNTLCRVGIFWVSFFSSCAQANIDLAKPKPPAYQIHSELSSSEAANGTILLVHLDLPPALRNLPITGQFEGKALPFFAAPQQGDGVVQAIIPIPYEHPPGETFVTVRIGAGSDEKLIQLPFKVVEGKYSSEILHVDGRRVNPSKKDLLRIRREQFEVGEIYRKVTLQKFWKGPFKLPIQSVMTSAFGTRRLYNGQLRNFHPGLDLRAPKPTPIYSAAPGIVVMAKNLFYTGNTVMIDHGYGVITLYAHMSKIEVKMGQNIGMQTRLGLSGKTGRVNGPHLHWQAVVNQTKVNPLGLVQVLK